jgi:transposase-like protein
MKRGRFTETQIVSILKEADAGVRVKDICRQHGISDATYYNWKSKYGGMQASDLKRLTQRFLRAHPLVQRQQRQSGHISNMVVERQLNGWNWMDNRMRLCHAENGWNWRQKWVAAFKRIR